MLKSLFTKKKSNGFKVQCALSKEPLDKASSYMLTTAEIVSSKKFWDHKMTEPETMSYTVSHFKNGDQTSTNMRKMIFQKYANEDKPWIISDSQIHLFDIDENVAKERGDQYWESKGADIPSDAINSLEKLGRDAFEEYKAYAIMYAGKERAKSQL